MAPKPKTSIRKPPTTNQNIIEAFVSGAEKSSGPEVQKSSSPEVQKSNHRTRRTRKQVTVYIDPDVAKQLKMRAVETGREMSEITEIALRYHLSS